MLRKNLNNLTIQKGTKISRNLFIRWAAILDMPKRKEESKQRKRLKRWKRRNESRDGNSLSQTIRALAAHKDSSKTHASNL